MRALVPFGIPSTDTGPDALSNRSGKTARRARQFAHPRGAASSWILFHGGLTTISCARGLGPTLQSAADQKLTEVRFPLRPARRRRGLLPEPGDGHEQGDDEDQAEHAGPPERPSLGSLQAHLDFGGTPQK